MSFSPLHPYTHRTQRLVWVPWCDSRNRASQCRRTTARQFMIIRIEANVRQPFQVPLDSAFDILKMNSMQQSTVGEVSQRLKVMALACRPAGPDNAAPSLPGSDSWLSEKKQKKNPKLVPARLGAVKLHFRCCRNILDVGLVTRLRLCLTVSPVRSTHDQCTQQASRMTCDSDVIEKPSRRWRDAVTAR